METTFMAIIGCLAFALFLYSLKTCLKTNSTASFVSDLDHSHCPPPDPRSTVRLSTAGIRAQTMLEIGARNNRASRNASTSGNPAPTSRQPRSGGQRLHRDAIDSVDPLPLYEDPVSVPSSSPCYSCTVDAAEHTLQIEHIRAQQNQSSLSQETYDTHETHVSIEDPPPDYVPRTNEEQIHPSSAGTPSATAATTAATTITVTTATAAIATIAMVSTLAAMAPETSTTSQTQQPYLSHSLEMRASPTRDQQENEARQNPTA
ncbi:hypothetical protein BX616_008553, partial [Lobosporangium transversale]